jgi:hypothetical protein
MKKMAAKPKTYGFVAHLRRWGLKVEEKDGWRQRGRPYDFYPRGVMVHHTASNKDSGNFPSDNIVTAGRSDLPGPLCLALLGRDGTVRLIASGYANHAGYGGPEAGIPANQGNTYTYGIEAENNGLGEPWPREQLNAYYRLCAALLDWMKIKDVSKVFGHKEWTFRKIDPAGIQMDEFRRRVQAALNQGPSVKTVHLSRLKEGKSNHEVLMVKRRLANRGFDKVNLETKYFGKSLTNEYKKWQEKSGVEVTGRPDKKSLMKLGFRVLP